MLRPAESSAARQEHVMVFVYLVRHWVARRHYPFPSWAACIARSLRVLLFYPTHARLTATALYRDCLIPAHDDVFHHLSHRDYLAKGLTLRERVRCVLVHSRFEEETFDAAYRQAVYRDGGLVLWQHDADGRHFTIRLTMASRLNAEGDLTLVASADGICLHRLSFSWVDSAFSGLAPAIVPFVARNQGHHEGAAEGFEAFNAAFPNNSPSFFCAAALSGVAQALGMEAFVAVKSASQSAYDPAEDKHFGNAYDNFWQTLGGIEMPGRAWHVALPFRLRPLSETPSKHRKRAAMRRAHWAAIAESACATIAGHLTRAHADAQTPAETIEPAPVLLPQA
jgi:uncharacterized protein VirK/YbjX